ncbi:hypothetical protein JAAARDRAFT_117304 [Jaapia argillacea MUCL 33604]|uniref:Urease accessory protein UreF n=1 Tax=Jaapia argillacea MUCL 33604 TaxID=933084 RepID=A0A067QE73_9AGAM|nr:hypothetical protein JAAARDRAFT_117304 [Jaapia argillacea MUCL 33604]
MASSDYLLLLLADSNLPTGSFVASAGLESYVTHGFFSSRPVNSALDSTVSFVSDSVSSYAHSSLPFVTDTHAVIHALAQREGADDTALVEQALEDIRQLDELYHAMTVNHVARRASKAQGVALLTLYSKGFSRPPNITVTEQCPRETRMAMLVDKLKLAIRREESHGHLPICWAVLAGALGLTLERSQYLHLFLHARSLLSASVRLNTLGPYASQQLLLHAISPLIEAATARSSHLRTGLQLPTLLPTSDQPAVQDAEEFDETTDGPAVTWPLGEILAARHDLQHSRIFNS